MLLGSPTSVHVTKNKIILLSSVKHSPVTESWKSKYKQDRQCMYNETLTRVRATIDAVEKQ